MITLNLLPDVKKEFLHAQRMRARTITMSIIVTLIAVGATVLLGIYVFAYQQVRLAFLDGQIEDRTAEIQQIPDLQKMVNVQHQLANIDALHEQKGIYSRLLSYLPQLNPQSSPVQLNELTFNKDEEIITLKGNVADYPGLKQFADTLRNAQIVYSVEAAESKEALFSEVTTSSASRDSVNNNGVSFEMTMSYNAQLFSRQISGVRVEVPNRNTTGSVQAAPDFFGNGGGE